MSTITRTLQTVGIALALTTAAGCQWPVATGTGSGSGTGTVAKVKYTCSNGSVETTDATCGNRATCEDLCQHSGGSGGSCSSSEYFCSVAQ